MIFTFISNSISSSSDCSTPSFYDLLTGEMVNVSPEELKEGKKNLEMIDFVSFKLNSKEVRLYSNGEIKESNGKYLTNININYFFNWVKAYEFKNILILRIGFNDNVDLDKSSLFLIELKTYNQLKVFAVPCMHNEEKLFIYDGKISYACRFEVEEKGGTVHSYFPIKNDWKSLKLSAHWGSYYKKVDIKEINVKKQMKFWKKVNLTQFEKRCW